MAISQELGTALRGSIRSAGGATELIEMLDAVSVLSGGETAYIDGVTAGVAAANKALVLGASKEIATITTATITTLTAPTVNATNVDAGASGAAGSVDVFPTTASKGKLAFTCTDQAGNTTVSVVAAAMAAARTLTIPDPGTAASFVMTEGAQTISGIKSFNAAIKLQAGTAAGAVALRFGLTDTEGLEAKVVDEVLSFATPSLSKALTEEIPSGAVILSVQLNVDAALTGGGTTTKVAIGPTGTKNKYGICATLTKNTKSNAIPAWAVLSGSEDVRLWAVANDGTTAGDTNLSVGSVRVRIVYLACRSLDNTV